jgi:phosphoribosylanthranilate isomerase
MPRIKISGITNEDDAKWAAILGVEFVSISLEENTDKKISVEKANQIRSMLPSYTGFIAELGEISQVNMRNVNKLTPGYVQFKNAQNIDGHAVNSKLGMMGSKAIYEIETAKPEPINAGNEDSGSSPESNNEEVARVNDENNGLLFNESVSGINFYQINLTEVVSEEKLNEIKNKYAMENTIIQGDWELKDIKKVCSVLQPYAWSIKTVIEKSPRRIDYNIMKKYIREISLW